MNSNTFQLPLLSTRTFENEIRLQQPCATFKQIPQINIQHKENKLYFKLHSEQVPAHHWAGNNIPSWKFNKLCFKLTVVQELIKSRLLSSRLLVFMVSSLSTPTCFTYRFKQHCDKTINKIIFDFNVILGVFSLKSHYDASSLYALLYFLHL